jgi:hypothetical protein
MQNGHIHKIQSIIFDVTLPDRNEVDVFADTVRAIDVQGIFESALAPLNFAPERILIDSLTFDLGTIGYDDLETALKSQLTERLAYLIAEKNTGPGFYESVKPEELELDALVEFLKYGTLHWAFKDSLSFDIERIVTNLIVNNKAFFKQKLIEILGYRVVQERLIQSVSNNVLKTIYHLFYDETELAFFVDLITLFRQHLAVESADAKTLLHEILLQNIISGNYRHDFSTILIQQVIKRLKHTKIADTEKQLSVSLYLKKLQEKYKAETAFLRKIQLLEAELNSFFINNSEQTLTIEEKKNKKAGFVNEAPAEKLIREPIELEPDDLPQSYFIENAGLVIVWYHLALLFENLGLVQERQFIDSKAQMKALSVLDFLVFGNRKIREYGLILNKILVGLEVEESIELNQLLTDDEIFIIEEYLQKAIIAQWTILKNASNDWLRQSFLQRNGKLNRTDKGWFLQVEPKGAIDITLNSLPWRLDAIQMNWMPQKLTIEWKRI